MTLESIRREVERRKGQRDAMEASLQQTKTAVERLSMQARFAEQAQQIIQNVAQITQEQLEYHVGELVTLAMSSVFENPYELKIEFVQRRGRTEADIWFVDGKNKISPFDCAEGGAVDVAAFALNVSLWSLRRPRFRNVLVLDEPLKFLKGEDLPEKGAQMMHEIASNTGLQIIAVSHILDQIEGADNRIRIEKQGKESHVL